VFGPLRKTGRDICKQYPVEPDDNFRDMVECTRIFNVPQDLLLTKERKGGTIEFINII
jgi:hypothetical protein